MSLMGHLRRGRMMTASGGVDVANLVIEGSCTFQDYGVVQMNDGDYRLLAITSSGNLVPAQPVNIEVCVVGGGANGNGYNGGAGAYLKNQVIKAFNGGPVVVGAAQGASSIGGVSVAAVSGKNGGTNGSNGFVGTREYDGYGSAAKGQGGAYGGGQGGFDGDATAPGSGANATYYGSGGGGYGGGNHLMGDATVGSGYQGIVYVRIPVDQATYISDLPLGALINVGTDGGAGAPNYEIADKDNLVSGGVVLVRKNIYSTSAFGTNGLYPNSTLDNLITATIYNEMPQKLRDKMMDVSFPLYNSDNITRKMFVLTYTMVGFGNNRGVAEGKALQLYTSDASRVKTFNGSAPGWWLSSRFTSNYAWYVYPDGRSNGGDSSNTLGVVPAFVIPSKTPYDPTPNTDGSYNLIL